MYPVDIATANQNDVQGWLGVTAGYVGYWDMLYLATNGDVQLRTLLTNVGRHPRMLQFLNNKDNQFDPFTQKSKANENYAREVQQLFSLGITYKDANGQQQPSYVEGRTDPADNVFKLSLGDHPRLANIFSGWSVVYQPLVGTNNSVPQPSFSPLYHNSAPQKMYEGNTFEINTDKDDVFIQQLFDKHPAAPQFYARRLAEFYISPSPDQGLVDNLAKVVKENDFNLGRIVPIILKSKAFYEARYANSLPVSPFLHAVKMARGLGMEAYTDPIKVITQLDKTYQVNFPDRGVFGWDHTRFSNSSVLPEKSNMSAVLLDNARTAGWSPASVAPGGTATTDQVIASVAAHMGISIDPIVAPLYSNFMSTTKQSNGTLVPLNYDNTNATMQTLKVTGLIRALSVDPRNNYN